MGSSVRWESWESRCRSRPARRRCQACAALHTLLDRPGLFRMVDSVSSNSSLEASAPLRVTMSLTISRKRLSCICENEILTATSTYASYPVQPARSGRSRRVENDPGSRWISSGPYPRRRTRNSPGQSPLRDDWFSVAAPPGPQLAIVQVDPGLVCSSNWFLRTALRSSAASELPPATSNSSRSGSA